MEPTQSSTLALRATALASWNVVAPLVLGAAFVGVFLSFDMRVYLALVVAFVAVVQVAPLRSPLVDNMILCCLPAIGACANVHHLCLTYNSIILFMFCRAYAVYGRVRARDVVVFLLIIASWPFHFEVRNQITYAGALLHGVVNPLSFYLYTRPWRWVRFGVFLAPGGFLVDNVLLYRQWFVAFWDVEILCVYLFWMLGYDKEVVVKRVLLCSLPVITFLQMHFPICPTKGYLVDLVFAWARSLLH